MPPSLPSPLKAPSTPHAASWKPKLTLAVAQMEVSGDLAHNRRIILEQLHEAVKKHHAKLVIFPETALSGYAPAHCASGQCDLMDFKTIEKNESELRDVVKKLRISVVVGTTQRRSKKYYNTALILGPKGTLLGRYDKIHLTGTPTKTLDSRCFTQGEKSSLKVHTVAGSKIGVQICFDMRFPETWRKLALSGARIFVHSTAIFGRESLWKREGVEGNLSSRASENSCWLASANSAGPHQSIASRILDPDGIVIVKAQLDAEEVICASIDPDWLGRAGGFLTSIRPDCY